MMRPVPPVESSSGEMKKSTGSLVSGSKTWLSSNRLTGWAVWLRIQRV